MNTKYQLSIAALLMAGVFATGCSQQTAGGSQIAGGSQSQIEGGAQMGSQQQVEEPAPVVVAPAPAPVAPAPAPKPAPVVNPWTHTHPAIPGCTDSTTHTHKYTNRNHTHHYSCKKAMRAAPRQPEVDVYALQRKLKAKGYYKGPVDGVVGPSTREALKRFMNR